MNKGDAEILVVDDERDIRNLIEGVLEDEGYRVRCCDSAGRVFEEVGVRVPDLVVLDIWLKDSARDGINVLDKLMVEHPHLPVIMISGHGNVEMAVSAIKKGAYDFIEKPFKSDRLLLMVRRALEMSQLQTENSRLKEMKSSCVENEDFVGESSAIQCVRSFVQKVAKNRSSVLIEGAAGCGKSFVARLLHERSDYSDKPYIVVHCHSLSADRFEAMLMGEGDNAGILERANGGTVYLDEISDLSFETQGKLLRIIQDRAYKRSRDGRMLGLDVRWVSSTSLDLNEKVEQGAFRSDLYFRLGAVPLKMPSLVERKGDIEGLVRVFSERYCGEAGVEVPKFNSEVISFLEGEEWPGNIRQLKNYVEYILIMSGDDGGGIDMSMMPSMPLAVVHGDGGPVSFSEGDLTRPGVFDMPMRAARELFEKEYLLQQIVRFSGNVSRTAEFIGMERSALHRKLKSLDLDGEVAQLKHKAG